MISRLVVAAILGLFVLLHVYVVMTEGFDGVTAALVPTNGWSRIVVVDLMISLGLIATWAGLDARRRGRSSLMPVALTLTMGSLASLSYLLSRRRRVRLDTPARFLPSREPLDSDHASPSVDDADAVAPYRRRPTEGERRAARRKAMSP